MKKIQLIAYCIAIVSLCSCSDSLCPDKLKSKGDSDGGLWQGVLSRWV